MTQHMDLSTEVMMTDPLFKPPPVLHHPSFLGGKGVSFFVPQPSSIKGDVTAIGPIRGRFEKLQAVWQKIALTENYGASTLVFLGDYLDGPRAKDVMDFLVALRHARPTTVFLCGAHDYAMVQFLGLLRPPVWFRACETWENVDPQKLWIGKDCENMHLQGRLWAGPEDRFNASETFKSYGVRYGDREGLLKAMPAEHKEFIRNLPWVVEHEKYIFVHGGMRQQQDPAEQLKALHDQDVDLIAAPRVLQLCHTAEFDDQEDRLYDGRVLVTAAHANRENMFAKRGTIPLDIPDHVTALSLPQKVML